jgi:hypothetical protein
MDIFFECSLKIPQIYSNISLLGGCEGLSGVTGGRVGVRTTLYGPLLAVFFHSQWTRRQSHSEL